MIHALALLPSIIGQSDSSDPRLAKTIHLAEYASDAPTVCADLAALTGVPITSDRFLRDDLMVLVVKRRSAAEIKPNPDSWPNELRTRILDAQESYQRSKFGSTIPADSQP